MTNVDTNHSIIQDVLSEVTSRINRLFHKQTYDLLTVLRQPTPQKVSKVITTGATTGTIGGGLYTAAVDPVELYRAPMSHEAWINRLSITSSFNGPKNPLAQGQIMISNSLGQVVYFTPIGGVTVPVIFTEGRLFAPHLAAGEALVVQADGLTQGMPIRFDLQLVLVKGESPDTPRDVPGHMNILD